MTTPASKKQPVTPADGSRLASVCFFICASALCLALHFGLNLRGPRAVSGSEDVVIVTIPGFDPSRGATVQEEYDRFRSNGFRFVPDQTDHQTSSQPECAPNARLPFGVSLTLWPPEIDVICEHFDDPCTQQFLSTEDRDWISLPCPARRVLHGCWGDITVTVLEMTYDADSVQTVSDALHKRGIVVSPDFFLNSDAIDSATSPFPANQTDRTENPDRLIRLLSSPEARTIERNLGID